jgi:hypothetical protein
MILFPITFFKPAGAVGYDADAQAFFTASGISNTTQKNAVNQLVLDFKAAGIWSKFFAIYPLVGGNATAHAVNLKSPGTYDMTFYNSPTHSSGGVQGDGATQFADTGVNPNTLFTSSAGWISIYSRTNITGTGYDISVSNVGGSANVMCIICKYGGGVTYASYTDFATFTVPTAEGLTSVGRVSTTTEAYKNGVFKANGSTGAVTFPNKSFFIMADNGGGGGSADLFAVNQYAYAGLGSGLDSTEAAAEYTAVQAYQTTLGRQV